jgi:protein-tyrosine phosphatase
MGSLAVLGLLVLGSGGGCVHAPEPSEVRSLAITRPLIERGPDGRLLLSWPRDLTNEPLRIYRGETPETIDRSIALAVAEPGTTELLLPTERGHDYFFYELDSPDDSIDSIVGERRLPLQGPDNFRDLGGYETRDGRRVRWHRIYRSDDLAGLTRRDLGLLRSLHIRGVCDLRSAPERARDPNRSVDGASVHEMGIPVVGVDPVDLRHRIRTGGLDASDVEATMVAAYRSFVTDHADSWARMLELLSNPANLPTVVHCTAGKDRTGFASALVLLLLGVPEETVLEDYLATNRYQARTRLWLERLVPVYSFFRTGAADMAPLLDARPAYLQASLEEIERGWGSVERYAEQRLGFSSTEQERLRSLLVE